MAPIGEILIVLTLSYQSWLYKCLNSSKSALEITPISTSSGPMIGMTSLEAVPQ